MLLYSFQQTFSRWHLDSLLDTFFLVRAAKKFSFSPCHLSAIIEAESNRNRSEFPKHFVPCDHVEKYALLIFERSGLENLCYFVFKYAAFWDPN